MPANNGLTDVAGIRVGHAHDEQALTGCTVVLCQEGAIGGVDQRGGAPGTRETDALYPMHLVQKVHAIVLAGGSAFGLDSASGAVRFLEERGIGFDVRVAKVPIVPCAILFDLNIGLSSRRPDAAMGYQACLNASEKSTAAGNIGAGCGATVGKILGIEHAMKSGLGSASVELGSGVIVAALAVVNAFGDVIDPGNGSIIAGARSRVQPNYLSPSTGYFADTLAEMQARVGQDSLRFGQGENTVIGVVATNAVFNKEQVNKIAQMAHDGLARTIRPAHTMLDGDTIFALSLGKQQADINTIGAFAAEVFAAAVLNAVRAAQPAGGLPSYSSLPELS